MFEEFFEGRNRSIAWHYLEKKRRQNLAKYPQMCCYSFEHIAQYINFDGRYEKDELDYVGRKLERWIAGKVVLDIGANIGNHTVFFAEKAAHVFSFEPHPRTFQLLKLNSENFRNVTAYNLGASDCEKQLMAVSPLLNVGATAIVADSDQAGRVSENERKILFNLVAIDDVAELAGADIGFVKIDVEGHELQALHGLSRILSQQKPVVMFEQHGKEIEGGTSPALDFLRERGYQYLYEVVKPASWRTPDSLPGFIRMPLKFLEKLFLGKPDDSMATKPLSTLEQRSYFVLIASAVELQN
ncbi:FkbM family methyltransferase [Pseudorhodoferax sp. Leaf274]|uniref:FkbM family methyltransferase n=1 Tax=Pseudorhodoferax sp. Leaf274 TaxID=1736318 RepID=UPI00138F77B6|nr:FkbM family methyltransferase [Pseudorhodoferax sp. Leaf274]